MALRLAGRSMGLRRRAPASLFGSWIHAVQMKGPLLPWGLRAYLPATPRSVTGSVDASVLAGQHPRMFGLQSFCLVSCRGHLASHLGRANLHQLIASVPGDRQRGFTGESRVAGDPRQTRRRTTDDPPITCSDRVTKSQPVMTGARVSKQSAAADRDREADRPSAWAVLDQAW
jgi:hypothetical protein